jgi:predicted nucleic acid-binding protein
MAEAQPTRGLLDTSVVVDHDILDASRLPDESAISAVTLAELAAATHSTSDAIERARRQDRLQWAAQTWDPIAFDAEAARSFARIAAAIRATGQTARPRVADLLIASTAAANALPLYTRAPAAFAGLEEIVKVVAV